VDLEGVWELREETIYPRLFGPLARGIFPLSNDTFRPFKDAQIDPRWLHCGVLEFAPFEERKSWLYITSGYSNPWETEPENYNEDDLSGSGVEFSIETQEASNWAISFLQRMLAYDMLLATGQFGERPTLREHDRIPLNGPISGQNEVSIRNAILHKPVSYEHNFSLPSGKVEILQFVGVTDNERDLARNEGFDILTKQLLKTNSFPITNLRRA
jgi:suppressor of fused protein SUFU